MSASEAVPAPSPIVIGDVGPCDAAEHKRLLQELAQAKQDIKQMQDKAEQVKSTNEAERNKSDKAMKVLLDEVERRRGEASKHEKTAKDLREVKKERLSQGVIIRGYRFLLKRICMVMFARKWRLTNRLVHLLRASVTVMTEVHEVFLKLGDNLDCQPESDTWLSHGKHILKNHKAHSQLDLVSHLNDSVSIMTLFCRITKERETKAQEMSDSFVVANTMTAQRIRELETGDGTKDKKKDKQIKELKEQLAAKELEIENLSKSALARAIKTALDPEADAKSPKTRRIKVVDDESSSGISDSSPKRNHYPSLAQRQASLNRRKKEMVLARASLNLDEMNPGEKLPPVKNAKTRQKEVYKLYVSSAPKHSLNSPEAPNSGGRTKKSKKKTSGLSKSPKTEGGSVSRSTSRPELRQGGRVFGRAEGKKPNAHTRAAYKDYTLKKSPSKASAKKKTSPRKSETPGPAAASTSAKV